MGTNKRACPKICTGKNDAKNPCIEVKGVGGTLVPDNDCCAVPTSAGCKSGYVYSQGDVCYRGRTFTAFKTVCTPMSSSYKRQCTGKVLSFGDYFIDTRSDGQLTCTNTALAIT